MRANAAAGAVLFGCVLLAVAVGGWLWLSGRHSHLEANGHRRAVAPEGARADKWTSRLGRFLQEGPAPGTWETRAYNCIYTHYIALHPSKPDAVLIAKVSATGVDAPQAVSRWLVPRFFFRAPAHLFFSNYVRTEGPIGDETEDGTKCWRVHWAPRDNLDGLSERIVWFAQVGGSVVQVEDRARNGRVLRRVRRIAEDTGKWDPSGIDPRSIEHIESARPDARSDPDRTLATLARKAPFAVYQPTYLPAGFVLVRATYEVRDATLSPAVGTSPNLEGEPRAQPVKLLSQLYSDGLALISVGVAFRADMDVIERLTAGMTEMDSPTSCPGLPGEPRDILHQGATIRMRSDACRTVVRRDDLGGVSVVIIGRNEIPNDEYLRMVATLELVEGQGPKDSAARQAGDGDAKDR